MVYYIWVFLGLLSLTFKKNKAVSLLVLIFIAIIFCYNTSNPDLINYQNNYIGVPSLIGEPIYNSLARMFYKAGFSFEVYRAVLTIVLLCCITWSFYQLTPYPTLALFLYSIYPLTLDVTQIRFSVGYAIVFVGVVFLIKQNNKLLGLILFLISVIIATGFHYSCALYSILGLLVFDIQKHRLFYLVIIPLSFIASIAFLDSLIPVISGFIGTTKTESWVMTSRIFSLHSLARPLLRAFPIFLILLFSNVHSNEKYKSINGDEPDNIALLRKNFSLNNNSSFEVSLYDIVISKRILFCVVYIWYMSFLEIFVAGTYERLSRLGLLLAVCLLTRELSYMKSKDRLFCTVALLIVYLIIFAIIMTYWGSDSGLLYFDNVFRRVMESNTIFGTTFA